MDQESDMIGKLNWLSYSPQELMLRPNSTVGKMLFTTIMMSMRLKNIGKSWNSLYNKNISSLAKQYVIITAAISSYWVCSIGMVFLNKYLLSSPDLKLDAVVFVTWYQCFTTIVFCQLTNIIQKMYNRNKNEKMIASLKLPFQCYIKKVLPLSLIFVGMITFNNLCLKYIGISFYYVGRSLTTVFNVIFSYIILGQYISKSTIVCCFVIIGGFLLGVNQEDVAGSLSVQGVVYGILASMFVSLSAIYIKKTLSLVDNSIFWLTYYKNLNALVLFFPIMLINGELFKLPEFEFISSFYFWAIMTISGFFGFIMSQVTTWQIQVTSPLTHIISGTAKNVVQTIMAVSIWQEYKPTLWWFSNIIILVGVTSYTHYQHQILKSEYRQENNKNFKSIQKSDDSASTLLLSKQEYPK